MNKSDRNRLNCHAIVRPRRLRPCWTIACAHLSLLKLRMDGSTLLFRRTPSRWYPRYPLQYSDLWYFCTKINALRYWRHDSPCFEIGRSDRTLHNSFGFNRELLLIALNAPLYFFLVHPPPTCVGLSLLLTASSLLCDRWSSAFDRFSIQSLPNIDYFNMDWLDPHETNTHVISIESARKNWTWFHFVDSLSSIKSIVPCFVLSAKRSRELWDDLRNQQNYPSLSIGFNTFLPVRYGSIQRKEESPRLSSVKICAKGAKAKQFFALTLIFLAFPSRENFALKKPPSICYFPHHATDIHISLVISIPFTAADDSYLSKEMNHPKRSLSEQRIRLIISSR